METAVFSLLDSGGVVQIEGTVGRQSRKSCLTSGGMSTGEITESGAVEWSLLDMRVWSLSSPIPFASAFMCDIASGFFFLKSARASSTCRSFQSTH